MSIRAAQYVRMSTDQQSLSIDNQKKAIAEYAIANGIEVVSTYSDHGKSGLTLHRRNAMQQLLKDVMEPACPFSIVLVLDVSRWGRFQDVDESAYYEYHCRKNGVQVTYVGEQFPQRAGPMDAVLKQLKRVMAAEYSRELAAKVRAGQERVVRMGFVSTRLPCAGFRRQVVTASGDATRMLNDGERKPLPTDRVRWVHGPEEELGIVRRVFEEYTRFPKTQDDIANGLNASGIVNRFGTPFTSKQINALLKCELVTGTYVWGRRSRKNSSQEREPLTVSGNLPPIIDKEMWDEAQRKRLSHSRYTPEMILRMLATAKEQKQSLSYVLEIVRDTGRVGRKQFGSVRNACTAAGYKWGPTVGTWNTNRVKALNTVHQFSRDIVDLLRKHEFRCVKTRAQTTIFVEGIPIKLKVAHPMTGSTGLCWRLAYSARKENVWLLFMRMNIDKRTGRDFYLLPPPEGAPGLTVWLTNERLAAIESYRLSNYQELIQKIRLLTNDRTHAESSSK